MSDPIEKWPEYYPSNCPPIDAYSCEVTVYRGVNNNPPKPEDFVPYRVLFPDKNFKDDECKACGLSVFKNLSDLKIGRKFVPGLRKLKYNARGSIKNDSGVLKETPKNGNSHMTWWIHVDTEPHNSFTVIEEV